MSHPEAFRGRSVLHDGLDGVLKPGPVRDPGLGFHELGQRVPRRRTVSIFDGRVIRVREGRRRRRDLERAE